MRKSSVRFGSFRSGGFRWRRRRRWRSRRTRLAETGFLDRDIQLDLLGGDLLGILGAQLFGFDQERIFQAVDFAEVPEERDPRNLLVAKLAIALPL